MITKTTTTGRDHDDNASSEYDNDNDDNDNRRERKSLATRIRMICYNTIRRYCTMMRCIGLWIIVMMLLFYYIAYPLLWRFWLSGLVVPDIEYKSSSSSSSDQAVLVRRRPDRTKKVDPITGIITPKTPLDGIMDGYLTLIDIQISKQYGLYYDTNIPYHNVSGTFCHISWHHTYRSKSSHRPSLHSLEELSQSPLCQSTLYHVADLYHDVMVPVTLYDQQQQQIASESSSSQPTVMTTSPTLIIFHESHAGSAVLSNMLSGYASFHVATTRVYREPIPLLQTLMACEILSYDHDALWGIPCDSKSQIQLLQDVFYLLGRIPVTITWPDPYYIFYQMDSVSSQHMDALITAMPQTPWMFLYRHSVEVLMSHFPHYYRPNYDTKTTISGIVGRHQNSSEHQEIIDRYYRQHFHEPIGYQSVCTKYYGHMDHQPDVLHDIVKRVNRTISSLSKEEYCAAYIATFVESALREHEELLALSSSSSVSVSSSPPRHWFINYEQLPYVVWEYLLPQVLQGHRSVTLEEREYMHAISTKYDASSSLSSKKSSLWLSLSSSWFSLLRTTTNVTTTTMTSTAAAADHDSHFAIDGRAKQNAAPPMIHHAAQLFLEPLYEKMEVIRRQQQ